MHERLAGKAIFAVVDVRGSFDAADAAAAGIDSGEVIRLAGASARQFRLEGLPTTAVIARDGIVRRAWIGSFDRRRLEEAAEAITGLGRGGN